ncbi:MAG: Smr/MutS family protein, partial [Methylophilaceae bacterium]
LRNWLIQRDEVLAYAQAKPHDGGSGAVIVLIRA